MGLLPRTCVLAIALGAAAAARAQDPFEIQVYDADVLDFGQSMEEFHVISKPTVTVPPQGQPQDPGLLHLTFEPQVGLGRDFETAFYIETSLWPDGSYHVAGAKLRFKWKLGASDSWPVRLAINAEIGNVDTNSEPYAWSGEIRPIVDWRFLGRCRALLNTNLGVPLGHDVLLGPQFEPQAKANCEVLWNVALGLEYYSGLGPIFDWLPLKEQSHYLFYTVDVYRWPKAEIGLGVGEPLTLASGAWTLNANLGIEFP